MQIYCGTDLIHIHRIEQAITRQGRRFLERVFTAAEIAACTLPDGSLRQASLAARFAAKEAIAKAFGTGIGPLGISWTDIEILSQPSGLPVPHLHGPAQARYAALGGRSLSVSLTHDQDLAQAFCVLLGTLQSESTGADPVQEQTSSGVRA